MTIRNRLTRATSVAAVIVGTMGLAVSTTATPGRAQAVSSGELRSVDDQMRQMQRELDVLQKHVYQGPSYELAQANTGPANLAAFQLRIDEMESQMRDMNGRIEELNHRVNQLNDRLDKFSSDVDFRLSNAAPAGGGEPSTAASPPRGGDAPITLRPPPSAGAPNRPPSTSGVLGTLPQGVAPQGASDQTASLPPGEAAPPAGQVLPDGSPQDQYNYAFSLLNKSDYPGAERALQAFLETHPTHALAGNAQYWLGETYYVRNDFTQAAHAFATGFKKYPKNAKAPDNLLKLGLSLGRLNKTKEACQSYSMLKSEFPKASPELIRRADNERKRLRCT